MKIKTNIRAGSGSSTSTTSGGVNSGGASGTGQNGKVVDVVPTVYYTRCTGI